MRKGKLVLFLLLVTAVTLFASNATQIGLAKEAYPNKDIELIVPFAAGGSSDLVARALVARADRYLGKAVAVENKSGGAAIPGTFAIAQAKPDGYTIGVVANGVFSLRPSLVSVPYKVNQFKVLMGVASLPLVITVRADSPWKTIDDLINAIKKEPGKIRFGSSGANNFPHIAVFHLCNLLKSTVRHIPYDGDSGAVTAILGGHVDFVAQNPSTLKGHVDAGTLRVLATFQNKRISEFPNIPTMKELGYNMSHTVWNMLVVPAGVPEARIKVLTQAFEKVVKDPKFKEDLAKSGCTLDYIPQKQAQQKVNDEIKLYKKLLPQIKE
jgi:tripartite-type tricarboxylate transporter receptor subunit TctC